MTIPAPGHDEITLATPHGQPLCNDRQHHNLGTLADVIITIGQFGTLDAHRQALWPDCWGRSYPLCAACWQTTRQIAARTRPHLVIKDLTCP